jgi:hypothetical protein
MHMLGLFPSSFNLKRNNCKNTRRFGSWLCFRHQVKPYNPVCWIRGIEISYVQWTQLTRLYDLT